jgi:hypothetical protein
LNTTPDSVEVILAKLTTARWYMDRVAVGDASLSRQNLEKARQSFDEVTQLLQRRTVSTEQYQQVQEQMEELRSRLQAAGEQV